MLNEPELDRELHKIWVRVSNEHVREWFKTVAKAHLLSLTGPERNENFLRVAGANTYRFDPIQPMRRPFWKTINLISMWLESKAGRDVDCSSLSFGDARKLAAMWSDDNNIGC